jgi:hypothetical protein
VFAAAAAALPTEGDGQPPILAWLYTVAHRRFADEARRSARTMPAVGSLRQSSEYSEPVGRAIATALSRLQPEQRRVVVLKLLRGLSFADIGEELGITPAAAKDALLAGAASAAGGPATGGSRAMTLRDRETIELLRDEPELLALADAVASTQRPRRRLPRRALAVAAVLGAAAVLALAAPWEGDDGNGLVLERALAAVQGDGPVVHSVVTMRDARRIELATGRVSYRELRVETWYDRERRRARFVAQRDGRVLADQIVAIGEPEPSLETFAPVPADLAEFYREALADGSARIIREGAWRGHAVYWLELAPPATGAWGAEVALDRDTYLPHVMTILDDEGRPSDLEFRFRVLETVPRRERDFAGAEKAEAGAFGLVPGAFSSAGSDSLIGKAAARSVLGRPALWAGPSIAGSRFTDAVVQELESAPGPTGVERGKGLELAYGTSVLAPERRGIVIEQVRDDNPARDAVVDGEPPPEGIVELQQQSVGSSEKSRVRAVLRRDGLLVAIEAPDESTALVVARALRPIP